MLRTRRHFYGAVECFIGIDCAAGAEILRTAADKGGVGAVVVQSHIGLAHTVLAIAIQTPGIYRAVVPQGHGMVAACGDRYDMSQIAVGLSHRSHSASQTGMDQVGLGVLVACGSAAPGCTGEVPAVAHLQGVVFAPGIDITILGQCQGEVVAGRHCNDVLQILSFHTVGIGEDLHILRPHIAARQDLDSLGPYSGRTVAQLSIGVVAPGIDIAIMGQGQGMFQSGGDRADVGQEPPLLHRATGSCKVHPRAVGDNIVSPHLAGVTAVLGKGVTQLISIIAAKGPHGTVRTEHHGVKVAAVYLGYADRRLIAVNDLQRHDHGIGLAVHGVGKDSIGVAVAVSFLCCKGIAGTGGGDLDQIFIDHRHVPHAAAG